MDAITPRPLGQFLKRCFLPAKDRPSIHELQEDPYLKCPTDPIIIADPSIQAPPSSSSQIPKKKRIKKRKQCSQSSKKRNKAHRVSTQP